MICFLKEVSAQPRNTIFIFQPIIDMSAFIYLQTIVVICVDNFLQFDDLSVCISPQYSVVHSSLPGSLDRSLCWSRWTAESCYNLPSYFPTPLLNIRFDELHFPHSTLSKVNMSSYWIPTSWAQHFIPLQFVNTRGCGDGHQSVSFVWCAGVSLVDSI